MLKNPEWARREYDIIIWGASGFTGRLVVEYLLQNYSADDKLAWAIAGRSRQKLDALVDDLIENGDHPPIFIADSHDPESLDRMAKRTKVVLSTVGPYALYGNELVAACVRNGTDYCDLCGEVQWMREMIHVHHANAIENGARIVMSCGFDSIPSDIGAWCLQRRAQELFGQPCSKLNLLVKAIKGGASGGTFASMLNAIDMARRDRSVAKVLADPYALDPPNSIRGPDGRDQTGPAFLPAANAWTAPFVMAGVNTRVVRRTNALLNHAYGRTFSYCEATLCGKGGSGWLKAHWLSIVLKLFLMFSAIPLTRKWIVQKLLPSPGEGPSKKVRETGFFILQLIGQSDDDQVIRLRITGDRDPGYGSTSKMLAESAICLALDEAKSNGGCLTPAAAMAAPLYLRLTTKAGLRFEFE